MSEVPLYAYVMVSALLFALGILGIMLHSSGIRLLMSIEMMLNASNLNFVAFGAHYGDPSGSVYVLFSIAIAAAEAAVGLAIFIHLFRLTDTVDVRSVASMKG